MATYVRVENNKVMETGTFTDQADIDAKWHTTVAAQWEVDTAGTALVGWDKNGVDDFAAPAAPTITVEMVKLEARRRIETVMPTWMVSREVSGGTAISATIKTYAADIRTDSAVLEGTLPQDYATNEAHWTDEPV